MKRSLLSRKTAFAVVATTLVVAGLIAIARASIQSTHWRFKPKAGPWGELDCVRIAIEMPETFISLSEMKGLHAHWFFATQSKADVENMFRSAGFRATEQAQLFGKETKWENDVNGIWVSPPDTVVLGMENDVRQKMYTYLSQFSQNAPQFSPFMFRKELISEILERSDLSPETVKKFRGLLYTAGAMTLFADTDVFVNNLPNEHEQTRFLKTISRTSTLLVKLKVDEKSNLDDLVNYWGVGHRKKDVRALLESMAAVPGGCKIDVAHLLPSFARQRIYTYPEPLDAGNTNHHCHWTSMNFLRREPDEKFGNEDYVRQALQSEFMPVADNPRLGDVVFFLDKDGSVIHSATFIADDVVFTKNGGAANRPWIYMQLEDLRACYDRPGQALKMVVCRRKDA